MPFSHQWKLHQLIKGKPLSEVTKRTAGSVLPQSVGFGEKGILPVPCSEKPQEMFLKVASANHLVPVIANICSV